MTLSSILGLIDQRDDLTLILLHRDGTVEKRKIKNEGSNPLNYNKTIFYLIDKCKKYEVNRIKSVGKNSTEITAVMEEVDGKIFLWVLWQRSG